MVIAIIAVLAGVLLIAINPLALLQKGRDSARMEDLDTLHKAISLSLADSEITLTVTGVCGTCTSDTGTQAVDGVNGWVQFSIPAAKMGLVKYIPALPVDPLNTAPNIYTYASDASNYELNTVFESADNTPKMTTDGGNDNAVYEIGTSVTVI